MKMNRYGLPLRNFRESSHFAIVFVRPMSSSHWVKIEKNTISRMISAPKPAPTTSFAVPIPASTRKISAAKLGMIRLIKIQPQIAPTKMIVMRTPYSVSTCPSDRNQPLAISTSMISVWM